MRVPRLYTARFYWSGQFCDIRNVLSKRHSVNKRRLGRGGRRVLRRSERGGILSLNAVCDLSCPPAERSIREGLSSLCLCVADLCLPLDANTFSAALLSNTRHDEIPKILLAVHSYLKKKRRNAVPRDSQMHRTLRRSGEHSIIIARHVQRACI